MHHLINLITTTNASTYELLMLVCFGASWPVAVLKTYQTKSIKGKSFLFLFLILLGYVFGIFFKIATKIDFVIWLYIINGLLVLADMTLWFMYKDNN